MFYEDLIGWLPCFFIFWGEDLRCDFFGEVDLRDFEGLGGGGCLEYVNDDGRVQESQGGCGRILQMGCFLADLRSVCDPFSLRAWYSAFDATHECGKTKHGDGDANMEMGMHFANNLGLCG